MVYAIETNAAPAAIGPYSQGVVLGDLIYTSGQIPVNPADGTIPESITEQAVQSLDNVKAVLNAAGATMNDVIKTTVFIRDMANFAKVNEVYASYFNGPVLPARSCVEVSQLPKGVLIEMEAIALKR